MIREAIITILGLLLLAGCASTKWALADHHRAKLMQTGFTEQDIDDLYALDKYECMKEASIMVMGRVESSYRKVGGFGQGFADGFNQGMNSAIQSQRFYNFQDNTKERMLREIFEGCMSSRGWTKT